MKIERSELIKILKNNLNVIRDNPNIKKDVKRQLIKHGITGGEVSSYLINPDIIDDLDIRAIGLLIEQIYSKTGNQKINIDNFFTDKEITEMRQYHHVIDDDSVHFPIELENFSVVGNGVYVGVISSKLVAQMMKSQVLYYNFDIQRQATKEKRMNEVILRPTIHKKNVKEIKNLILKGQLVDTTLAFNAAIGTSDDGEELTYNSKTRKITINEGTRLDILDGMHRCLGSLEAYEVDKNNNTYFALRLSNHTTRQAQQYQAQLAKATPIPKTRIQELEANRYSDTVMQILKSESELRDKISSTHRIASAAGELVSYNTLADAIEENFKMQSRLDAVSTGKYLSEFFDYLFDYFIKNEEKYSSGSLILYNKMFAGYVVLASRMKNKKKELENLYEILDNIDFSRENPKWNELGIIENGKITNEAEKEIKKVFHSIEL